MNKKKILTIILIILFIGFVAERINTNKSDVYEEQNKISIKKNKNMLSMNLEQTAGAGDYKTVTQSSWPTEGYEFNTELSRCEKGSELSWDDTKKAVIMQGNVSDKCYVYFDIWIPSIAAYCTSGTDLATCVKNFGDQGPSVSNIYIHNSALTNGAGDNSYRYAGANPNNFICFGSDATTCPDDNLYRIIGVIDGKVKLIKYDYANSNLLGTDGDYEGSGYISEYKGKLTNINLYYWNYKNNTTINNGNGSNTWSTSLLNKTNLNTNFINNIGVTWANKIATTTWKVGGNTQANIEFATPSTVYKNEIINPVTTYTTDNATTYDAKIGLMYVSDYMYGATPDKWTLIGGDTDSTKNYKAATSVNWMYMGGTLDWTISRNSNYFTGVNVVYFDGIVTSNRASNGYVVRPSFNLESSVKYVSGSGSMSDPVRIK